MIPHKSRGNPMKILVSDAKALEKVASARGILSMGSMVIVNPPTRRTITFRSINGERRRYFLNIPETIYRISYKTKKDNILQVSEAPDIYFLKRELDFLQSSLLMVPLPNINLFGQICLGSNLGNLDDIDDYEWHYGHKATNVVNLARDFLTRFWLSEFTPDRLECLPVEPPTYGYWCASSHETLEYLERCERCLQDWSEQSKKNIEFKLEEKKLTSLSIRSLFDKGISKCWVEEEIQRHLLIEKSGGTFQKITGNLTQLTDQL